MEEEIIKSANDTMMQLHNEVMQLNKRIDKAIEYIEDNRTLTGVEKTTDNWEYGQYLRYSVNEDILYESQIEELLKILKGE